MNLRIWSFKNCMGIELISGYEIDKLEWNEYQGYDFVEQDLNLQIRDYFIKEAKNIQLEKKQPI